MNRLVIVGGAPASGKTTLAGEIARSLGLPVITKDDVKEALAAPFATGDRDWSRQLGVAAYSVLFAVAQRGSHRGSRPRPREQLPARHLGRAAAFSRRARARGRDRLPHGGRPTALR